MHVEHDSKSAMALQVQALWSLEKYLNLDALYVLGTNCMDYGPRQGLEKFLNVASSDPDSVLHYKFVQVSPWLCIAAVLLLMLPLQAT